MAKFLRSGAGSFIISSSTTGFSWSYAASSTCRGAPFRVKVSRRAFILTNDNGNSSQALNPRSRLRPTFAPPTPNLPP
ncbi:hypothetical protein PR003_g25362 [Phytophthora rubi]|uniref:Uncharacterized protein n=1 Tax=Phytophthora rubi TaxID=129364 RepID=A0A6A4CPQ7_9STRA|nr:hypothetical protein PR002_g24895 [Phytophthora rubi]KAE8979046.1 hypothetical protein PR001_g24671 [Phytophthora rubi]KAE9290161.1 hypothetical protein PR003_g25362 [Phytophthora rubi]